ncbi:hypothetical protein BGX29_007582 [Mortierella sp. GBA35]|nr:hypothetical protein BGX29_007582 [Mortierella sp. GBA35]
MADNNPMADNNSMTDSNSMADDTNPLFNDFFELDLLDPTDANADLFSFLLNNDALNDMTNSPSSLSSTDSLLDLSTLDNLNTLDAFPSLEDLSNQENALAEQPVKTEDQDLHFLLAHNLHQQQQQEQQDQIAASASASAIDNSSLVAQLTSPVQLNVTPQHLATPAASPATPTMKAPESTISTAAATAQIAILLDSSKSTAATASTTTAPATPAPATPVPAQAPSSKKRSSPEPSTASRKKARSEATPALTPISAKAPPTLSTLTSTVSTTLSAATLQFLLEQQMKTPLVPQLFTGKLTREEIEETLARLLESTKYLIEASKEAEANEENMDSDGEVDEMEGTENSEQTAGQTHGLKTQPGIKTDDIPNSTDLKKMTSKERRQLRNKISARNFRVRRKEYITTLEGQVEQHKTEARHLREAVTFIQAENKRLKEELEATKRQVAQATITHAASSVAPQQLSQPTPLSSESQSLLTSLLTRSALNPGAKSNITLTMPRPSSPIIKPNLHKDVPNSSSVSGKSWKDENPVFVHTTLIPEIHLADSLQFGPKPVGSKEDDMSDRPWMCMESPSKNSAVQQKNPLLMSGVIYELMQTVASASLTNAELTLNKQEKTTATQEEKDTKATSQDYESDRRLGEALEWKMQLDLWKESQATARALAARRLDVDQDINSELSQEDLMRLFSHMNVATLSAASTPTQEDPNMMDWLYESLMAGLVALDSQNIQDRQTFLPFSEVHYA